MSDPVVDSAIGIGAPAAKVWLLIVNARATAHGFGCVIECSWRVGSPVVEREVTTGAVLARGTLV